MEKFFGDPFLKKLTFSITRGHLEILFKFVEIESGTFKYIGAPIIGTGKVRIKKVSFLTHPSRITSKNQRLAIRQVQLFSYNLATQMAPNFLCNIGVIMD